MRRNNNEEKSADLDGRWEDFKRVSRPALSCSFSEREGGGEVKWGRPWDAMLSRRRSCRSMAWYLQGSSV